MEMYTHASRARKPYKRCHVRPDSNSENLSWNIAGRRAHTSRGHNPVEEK